MRYGGVWSARECGVSPERAQHQAAEGCSDEWPKDRNRRVAPVRATLARDWQHSVRKARTQITRRVDGVSGGCAQREPDAPDKAAHQIGSDARCGSGRKHKLRCDAAGNDDQNEGADDLA
jgi:hypothetical protein